MAFAPGWSGEKLEEKLRLTATLTKLMFPYVVLVSVLALTASILNTLGRFAWPACAPAILNVSIITGALVVSRYLEEPVFALAWAVLIGGMVQLAPQLIQLRSLGFGLHISSPIHSPAVRKLLKLMFPSIFSASLYQIMVFINTVLASMLVERSITWLFFADRLFQFPLGVFTMAVATAVLPTLSRLGEKGDLAAVGKQLTNALAWISFITIPASVGLIFLADPIITTFFEHRKFTSFDTAQTAKALIAFSIGLWAVSSQIILIRGYLALKRPVIPSVVTSVVIVLNMAIAFSLMGQPTEKPTSAYASLIVYLQSKLHLLSLGHAGLALAGSLSAFFSVVLLTLFLPRLGIWLDFDRLTDSLRKACISSALMAIALWALSWLELNSFVWLLAGLGSGLGVYALVATLLKSAEMAVARTVIAQRIFLRDRP